MSVEPEQEAILKPSHTKDTIELVAFLAVIASLIFVGLQLRQSHAIALADQYQARAEAFQNLILSLQESGMSFSSVYKLPDEMTPEERRTSENVARWAWTQYDNHYYQYEAGFLDDESWKAAILRIQRLYSACSQREIWARSRPAFRKSFVDIVDSLNDPCEKQHGQ
jgi:hypothetical protein